MNRLAAAIAAIFVTATLASAAPVAVDGGHIEGVPQGGVTTYKGIPFAAPPVGELRWREPQPAKPWDGVKLADRFAPICMQRGSYPEDAPPEPMSEDCLYLNVWAPVGAAQAARLPVMVWIYGGGLVNGTASTPLYDGAALARRGVIVVTANYRLGALGFLAHAQLSRESPNKVSGNYGLLDQLAALHWVKRNIAAFGGDPGNVTVFGQSSGSISISALTVSPLARGLFQRAIGQSGGLFEPLEVAPEFALDGAEKIGAAFANKLGAPSLQALRAKPAADIAAVRFPANAVVDGYVLKEPPFNAYAAHRVNDVDILTGSNAEEGLAFLGNRKITPANLTAALGEDFPPLIVSLIGPKTPATDKEALAAYIAFQGDMRFGWDMLAWARLHAGTGRRKAFLYRFAYVAPGEAGARHGTEMAYVFGNPGPKAAWSDADKKLAETMAAYWTNFAKTGDPNGPGLPAWPQFARAREHALLIGTEINAGRLPNAANLAQIDGLYATVRFVLNNLYLIGAAAALIAITLFFLTWRLIRRLLGRRGVAY
jgi:para-nitrobenzyl esterase